MAKLTIPKEYRPGVGKLGDLDDATVQKLLAAIKSAPPRGEVTSSSLLPMISPVGIENPQEIADTMSALYRVKSSREVTVEEFVNDVCDAMGVSGADRNRLNKKPCSSTQRRGTRFECKSFGFTNR